MAPDPGGYVKVQRRRADGSLEDSFAVEPLQLPPYSGELSGELPLYATGYIRGLARRDPDFVLRGEGKTRVNGVPAYHVLYTAVVEGRTMYGRDVLLLPERRGRARRRRHRDADLADARTRRSTRRWKSPRRASCCGR